MIEVILILGLLFILGLTVIIHLTSTLDIEELTQIRGNEANKDLHPWFLTTEGILLLTIIYIGQHL